MNLLIINGPNLNLLGNREPGIYGNENFEDYLKELQGRFHSHKIDYYQSNVEGEIVNYLQDADDNYDGILLNAAAYTHTSVAIGDAIAVIQTPVIEIHISNVYARESYRHNSLIAGKCKGVIAGLGLESYRLGISWFVE